jgi:hypothetical protein
MSGSTLADRRAGIVHAARENTARTIGTTLKATASSIQIPYSSD